MAVYYLMGGRFQSNGLIIKDILEKKAVKSILFVDSANRLHNENFARFKAEFCFMGASYYLYDERLDAKSQFDDSDLIFFNGGRTEDLMKEAILKDFKSLLKDDKIYVGVSAGAIMFFDSGYGDKNAYLDNRTYYGFDFTKGLNIFNYLFCPHYNKEGILSFNEEIKKYDLPGFALTDGALMKIEDSHFSIIKEKNAESFVCTKDKIIPLKMGEIYEI